MKMITTPVLRFWRLKRQPFDDYILRKEYLNLFINRHNELRRLHNSLSNPLCGVFGTQGVGKSSVLFKLSERITADGIQTVNVEMAGISANLVFREVLLAILKQLKAGTIKLNKRLQININEEIKRVDYSIKHTSSVEAAGEMGAKAIFNLVAKIGIREGQTFDMPKHNEDTALALIQKIIRNTTVPFVVMIDSLERVRFLMKDINDYFQYITNVARTVDSYLSDPKVSFVVTLCQHYAKYLEEGMPGAEEDSSFTFGQIIQLGNFPPDHLYAIIKRRLEIRGWKKSVEEFISTEAFWGLMLASGGHARIAFKVMREAMELVSDREKELHINIAHMKEAAQNWNRKIDEKDALILNFLAENGPHSSSDKGFYTSLKITRQALRDRLSQLESRGIINVRSVQEGSVSRDEYYITKID